MKKRILIALKNTSISFIILTLICLFILRSSAVIIIFSLILFFIVLLIDIILLKSLKQFQRFYINFLLYSIFIVISIFLIRHNHQQEFLQEKAHLEKWERIKIALKLDSLMDIVQNMESYDSTLKYRKDKLIMEYDYLESDTLKIFEHQDTLILQKYEQSIMEAEDIIKRNNIIQQ
jgi:hypothetical protein